MSATAIALEHPPMTRLQQLRAARDLALRRRFIEEQGEDVAETTARREGIHFAHRAPSRPPSDVRERLKTSTHANLRQARQLAERQATRR